MVYYNCGSLYFIHVRFTCCLCLLPHPGALTKVKDCSKQESELHERCNIISCATLAEIQHFHRTRVRDFRSQMQHHLRQQIGFFQKITAKLEDALQRYDDDH